MKERTRMEPTNECRHANEISQNPTPSDHQELPQERRIRVVPLPREQLWQRLTAARATARNYRLARAGSAPFQATVRDVDLWYTLSQGGGPHSIAELEERRQQAANEQTTRVALYARATEHTDVAGHLAVLHAAAMACGWTVARTITSQSSGTGRDYPAMQIVRDAAHAGVINVVLITSFDCLTRNTRDRAAMQDDLAAVGCVIVVAAHTRDTRGHDVLLYDGSSCQDTILANHPLVSYPREAEMVNTMVLT
jgi:hypothetical protein